MKCCSSGCGIVVGAVTRMGGDSLMLWCGAAVLHRYCVAAHSLSPAGCDVPARLAVPYGLSGWDVQVHLLVPELVQISSAELQLR